MSFNSSFKNKLRKQNAVPVELQRRPPISVKCHISQRFVRLITLSRDEWTYAALVGRIRQFKPNFNAISANGI